VVVEVVVVEVTRKKKRMARNGESLTKQCNHSQKTICLNFPLLSLASTKARLTNSGFTPISTRYNFHDCTYILDVFKADMKVKIVKLMDPEIKVATAAMHHNTCLAIGALGIALSLHKFGDGNLKAQNLTLSTIESHEELLKPYGLINTSDGHLSDLQMFISDLPKPATNNPDEAHIIVGSIPDAYLLACCCTCSQRLQVPP
jgi:hypothetical protein